MSDLKGLLARALCIFARKADSEPCRANSTEVKDLGNGLS